MLLGSDLGLLSKYFQPTNLLKDWTDGLSAEVQLVPPETSGQVQLICFSAGL